MPHTDNIALARLDTERDTLAGHGARIITQTVYRSRKANTTGELCSHVECSEPVNNADALYCPLHDAESRYES